MASWKKVIVSGSQAELAGITGSLLTDDRLLGARDGGAVYSTGIEINGDGHLVGTLSGSASGSFEGDGSGLTGVVAQIENSLIDGNGIADFTFDGSSEVSVAVEALSARNGQIQPVSVAAGGVGFDVDLLDGTGLTATDGVLNVGGLTVSEFADAAIVTESEGIASSDNDTSIPTAAAVKDYVDAQSHDDVNLGYTSAASQGTVTNDQGSDAVIPGATSTEAGLLTVAISESIALNNAKETNVTTDLGYTAAADGGEVTSSDGGNATLPLANDTNAGLLSPTKLAEINANTAKTVVGTNDEIDVVESPTGTFTIGLTEDVIIPRDLTVTRDLTVLGDTTTLSTSNLLVKDAFILVASGSTGGVDGGLIVDGGDDNGEGFVFDQSAGNGTDSGRWGFESGLSDTATSTTPDAFVSAVVIGGAGESAPASTNRYTAKGNMFIDENDEIFIYS